jgi:hypothetical protein
VIDRIARKVDAIEGYLSILDGLKGDCLERLEES